MEHLIGLGHRRIVLAIHNVSDTDHADRRRAYEDAIATADMPVDPTLIMELAAGVLSGEQVLDAILAMPDRPTAVFATNPMTALGIMRRAQERGVVIPADLSVIGVDDSDVRMHVWPRLTAVTQDASMIGYEAAAWLTTVLSQEDVGKSCRRTVPTAFEVNGTTAAPSGRKASSGPDGGRAPAARRSQRSPAVSARKS
jgi:LacI family transcriptional regulator